MAPSAASIACSACSMRQRMSCDEHGSASPMMLGKINSSVRSRKRVAWALLGQRAWPLRCKRCSCSASWSMSRCPWWAIKPKAALAGAARTKAIRISGQQLRSMAIKARHAQRRLSGAKLSKSVYYSSRRIVAPFRRRAVQSTSQPLPPLTRLVRFGRQTQLLAQRQSLRPRLALGRVTIRLRSA